jgi:hypothetical protein
MCRKRTKGLEWIWKEWLQKQKKKLNSIISWPTNWVNTCSATTPGLQRTSDIEKNRSSQSTLVDFYRLCLHGST